MLRAALAARDLAGVEGRTNANAGDQSSPLAGPNKNGTRHTSGNLRPEFGGTGNHNSDLKTLAGNTWPAPWTGGRCN